MSDTADLWNDAHAERKADSRNRRNDAEHLFAEASEEASQRGLTLRKCSPDHYQLSNGHWLLNLYPGNQRIYADRNRAKAPLIRVPGPWTLMACVTAAADAEKET